MVSLWSLSDNKSPLVSKTLLSILADLNNVVVWMVSTRPVIFMFSSPFNDPLVTLPRAPIKMGINITFMFHSFFQFPSKVEVLILLFKFFLFHSVARHNSESSLFSLSLLLIIIRSGRLAEIIIFFFLFL